MPPVRSLDVSFQFAGGGSFECCNTHITRDRQQNLSDPRALLCLSEAIFRRVLRSVMGVQGRRRVLFNNVSPSFDLRLLNLRAGLTFRCVFFVVVNIVSLVFFRETAHRAIAASSFRRFVRLHTANIGRVLF